MSQTITRFTHFEWIDIENPKQAELEALSVPLNLDYNLLKDSLQVGHLPKIEKVSDYTFLILRAFSGKIGEKATSVGQLTNKIAFFINEKRLITIHRASFSFLKNRADQYESSERLFFSIVYELLSTYELPLQHQSSKMDEFEKTIFLRGKNAISIESLYYEKTKARILKKILQLTQNVLNQYVVSPDLASELQDTKETTVSYLMHFDEVVEDTNTILNTYLSLTAKKSNDVMKLLTVFSAFFLPLTFVVGIYGMNFRNMPELSWENGYYLSLAVMLLIVVIIYFWFRRKNIF